MNNNFKKYIVLLLTIVIFLLVYNKWIFTKSIITHGDWWFFFTETMSTIRFYYFSLWLGDTSLGRVLIDSGQAPTYGLYGALAKYFNFDYSFSERLIHLWPVIFLTPFSSYLLLQKIFKNNIAVFIGVLVYSFNTYFVIIQTGHLTLMGAFSFAPLIILFYQLTLGKNNVFSALLAGLLLFLSASYEPRAFYLITLLLFFYFIYYFFFIQKIFTKYTISKLAFFAFVPILIVGLLNFYWILGLSQIGALSSNELFRRELFGNEFLSLLSSITLFQPFWTGHRLQIFEVQPIPIHFWLIPLFAFLGLYLNRKNKNILFFGIIALIGIFLTKQIAPPFSGIYPFLFKYLPGFNAFREASKFYFLIALGYSVLIAGFIDWIWNNWTKKGLQTYGKYFLTLIIAFIFLWNTKPLITGEIGTVFVPRYVPSDYEQTKKFILDQNDYFRTAWIPTSSRWSIYTNSHPKINIVEMVNTDWNKFIKSKRNDKITEAELMRDIVSSSFSDSLFDLSSVKYVIIPLRDNANDDDFFIHYGNNREFYINALDELDYLERIDIETREIAVYENAEYRPHIYLTENKEQLTKIIPYQNVKHEFINPTKYKISLSGIENPVYLNFSESFHQQWKVRVGEFNWFAALVQKDYFLSDEDHFKNDAQLNSFRINPDEVCKIDKVCKVNSDGSYDIDITLYFAPQSYMYLGLIISGTTLILVFSYLFSVLGRKLYEKKN